MISAKLGPNQTNRFDIIALFVNYNWASAAILDFAQFVPGAITTQSGPGSQIDQYGMTFIPANFHISITKCHMLIGKVPLLGTGGNGK